jgi:hypothetical protein
MTQGGYEIDDGALMGVLILLGLGIMQGSWKIALISLGLAWYSSKKIQ